MFNNNKINIHITSSYRRQLKVEVIPAFNTNTTRSYHQNYIKPLKNKQGDKFYNYEDLKPFSTMDIETITLKNFDNLQIPVSISSCSSTNLDKAEIFLIDNISLQLAINNNDLNTMEELVNKLWKEYIEYILKNPILFSTIFVHNLGKFDGLFLYKGLLSNLDKKCVTSLIDEQNKFISISISHPHSVEPSLCGTLTLWNPHSVEPGKTDKLSQPGKTENFKITFKDSYRIFPISLKDLCKNFDVIGKSEGYNPKYQDINLFNDLEILNNFKIYSLQDSIALCNAMNTAQILYFQDYKVDITDIFSASTLSLKIFRQQFLNVDIPIMNRSEDTFVRRSYFGGATDIYKALGKNLHYYDVNSLYSYAMLNPMPLDFIQKYEGSDINLDSFFGFLEVEVTTPQNITKPILPVKYEGKTIFPTGQWTGTYFSEELKLCASYGYKFKILKGYEYSKS
jgi:DNA polymerase type B, organellar and viral